MSVSNVNMKLILFIFMLTTFSHVSDTQNNPLKTDDCDFKKFKPVRLSEITPVKKRVEPQYPKVAKEAKITGSVTAIMLIDRRGNVFRACAINGHPLLKDAAIKAALQWKFEGRCRTCLGKYLLEKVVFNFQY